MLLEWQFSNLVYNNLSLLVGHMIFPFASSKSAKETYFVMQYDSSQIVKCYFFHLLLVGQVLEVMQTTRTCLIIMNRSKLYILELTIMIQ